MVFMTPPVTRLLPSRLAAHRRAGQGRKSPHRRPLTSARRPEGGAGPGDAAGAEVGEAPGVSAGGEPVAPHPLRTPAPQAGEPGGERLAYALVVTRRHQG